MKVRFEIQKKHKAELYQIWMFISDPIFKPEVPHYTGERIHPKFWNKKAYRGRGAAYDSLNEYLDALKRKADNIRLKLKAEDRFTREDFINEFNGEHKKKSAKSLFEWFDSYIEYCQEKDSSITDDKLTDRTITVYSGLKNILLDFEKHKNIKLTLNSFDADFYKDFKNYIINERYNIQTKQNGGKLNTFSGHIKNIKSFLKWVSKSVKVNEEYKDFRKKFVRSDDVPFREDELLSLYNLDFRKYSVIKKVYNMFLAEGSDKWKGLHKYNLMTKLEVLARARLVLLLLASTGKRISDYEKMEEAEEEGELIIFKARKNQVICYVPNFDDLYFRPKYIIDEMKKSFGGLPKVSGTKLNDALVDLAKILGLTRFVPTSKTGRITFATLKVKSGVRPEIIMLSTGHKSRKSFDTYVRMDAFDVIQENKDKAQYLKVS